MVVKDKRRVHVFIIELEDDDFKFCFLSGLYNSSISTRLSE